MSTNNGLSRRSLLQLAGASAAIIPGLNAVAQDTPVQDEITVGNGGPLELACTSFDCTPPLGFPAEALGVREYVTKIEGPLETRVFALRQGDLCIGWGNSDFNVYDQTRQRLSETLKIPLTRTIHSCTHNHSAIRESGFGPHDKTGFTTKFFGDLDKAVSSLPEKFTPVTVSWATGEEGAITYNRKGRCPNGCTYFMREEDRIRLAPSYTGVIDTTASVIRFDGREGEPKLLMTHFTGHPVIAYNLEAPVANPDYSGWSIIDLIEAHGKARPVGVFLQGCAGDINAKGMFEGPALARQSGAKLGKVFIEASRRTKKVNGSKLGFATGVCHVPYRELPSMEDLLKQKEILAAFDKRLLAGDESALYVIGYNFSETMQIGYRRNISQSFVRWTDWAIQMRKEGKAKPLESLEVRVQVTAIGDLAIVTMPHELFVGIGFSIRKRSPFAYTVPAAYSNALYPGYIGTTKDVGDTEYMSSYYRHITKPPYDHPCGDVIADKAVDLLTKLKTAMA
jgi:hypothetical protein